MSIDSINQCATVKTYTKYTTIITTVTIRSLFLSAYNLFASHTYITYVIVHYNPSVRIIDVVPYTTYVVCVNFIHN